MIFPAIFPASDWCKMPSHFLQIKGDCKRQQCLYKGPSEEFYGKSLQGTCWNVYQFKVILLGGGLRISGWNQEKLDRWVFGWSTHVTDRRAILYSALSVYPVAWSPVCQSGQEMGLIANNGILFVNLPKHRHKIRHWQLIGTGIFQCRFRLWCSLNDVLKAK